MTAIFTVWNDKGFALASDSNQTGSQNNQTWVDPVEKIIMLREHQVAFGASGSSTLCGVELNEIIRTWEKFLPPKGYPLLEDYFVDFACWFALQEFNRSVVNIPDHINSCKRMFNLLLDNSDDEEDLKKLLDAYSNIQHYPRKSLNIFGDSWDNFANPNLLLSNFEGTKNSEQRIEDLRIKVSEAIRDLQKNLINLRIDQHPEFETKILPATLEAFSEVFDRQFESGKELDQQLIKYIHSRIENELNFALPVQILIVGFGNNEWLPSGIIFHAAESDYSVPRIKIHAYSNPRTDWYLSLAVDSAVDQFSRGHSRERALEVIEMAKPHLKKGHAEQFSTDLQSMANEKFHSSLERLDVLTLERLEFVSRLFVQIEALKSFLDEPVPGVGGDTKVIAMTKTLRREKNFRELS